MEISELVKKNYIHIFKWLNEPKEWSLTGNDIIKVTTDSETDFWQNTWYNFNHNSGHVFGIDIKDKFTFEACIQGDYKELYDQAGLMIYLNEKHWLKTGLEYNDGQPMIGSVLTNENSDWASGLYKGNPQKFWLRLSLVANVVCVKYSMDNVTWILLRLCPFPVGDQTCFVGLTCCSPKRRGLNVTFSQIKITEPAKDILHSN